MMVRRFVAVALMVAAFLFVLHGVSLPQNNNCTEFGFNIATTCCCSNDCCRESNAGEFQHIGDDLYRSVETGQTLRRTGWSPDGRTIKCACDFIDGQWTKHKGANVRCLFVPMPSS